MFSITSVLISSAIWCLNRGGKGKGSEGGRGSEGGKEGDIGGVQLWMYTAVSWWYVHCMVRAVVHEGVLEHQEHVALELGISSGHLVKQI